MGPTRDGLYIHFATFEHACVLNSNRISFHRFLLASAVRNDFSVHTHSASEAGATGNSGLKKRSFGVQV